MVETILSSLFTGLIGLAAGHRLRIGSEAAERRRTFRAHIDILLATLRDTDDGMLFEFHYKTQAPIRDECAKIRSDIFCLRRRRMDEVGSEYYYLNRIETRRDLERTANGMINKGNDFPGREMIQGLLKKMQRYAK